MHPTDRRKGALVRAAHESASQRIAMPQSQHKTMHMATNQLNWGGIERSFATDQTAVAAARFSAPERENFSPFYAWLRTLRAGPPVRPGSTRSDLSESGRKEFLFSFLAEK